MKVKVRVNIHGIFSVSSASLVEVLKSDETEEPMETEQTNEKDGEVLHVNTFLSLSSKRVLLYSEIQTQTWGKKRYLKLRGIGPHKTSEEVLLYLSLRQ